MIKTFKQYLNENTSVNNVVPDLIGAVAQLHMWHIVSKSLALHNVLGDLYEELAESVDELAELYIGSGYELTASKTFNLTPVVSEELLMGLCAQLNMEIDRAIYTISAPQDQAILDAVIGVQSILKRAKYKLKMRDVK